MEEVIMLGWEELDKQLSEFPAVVQVKALRKAVNAGVEVLVDGTRSRVPVGETGHLQASIVQKGARVAGDEIAGGVAFIHPYRERWWWLEYGTSKMSARSFLRPTVLADGAKAIAAAGEVLRAEVAKLWKNRK